jgi:hypothetical protein
MADIVWLASYPKSGNTWTRAFLTSYLGDADETDINDLEGGPIASSRQIFDLAVGIEAACLLPEEVENLRPAAFRVQAREQGRRVFMKTHDAWTRTPAGEPLVPADVTHGVVYIVRNPLDVAVSAMHHFGLTTAAAVAMLCDEAHLLSHARGGLADQLPQRLLSWSSHVRSWVDASALPIYVIRYEDMLADPQTAFGGLVRFAGLDYNAERVAIAVGAASFETLQRQEQAAGFRERSARAAAPFFRSGQAGSWRNTLTQADIDTLLAAHGATMARFGYLDPAGAPV